jgi:opacity protein-like surface antigen
VILGLFAAVFLVSGSLPAIAADSNREETWQFYFPITYVSSESFDGQSGTFVDLNSDIGFGVAFGYNFDERWFLGGELTWMNMSYNGEVAIDDEGDGIPDEIFRISGTSESSSIQLSGQYNFLKKSFTPFVRASLGSTYIDSNIASGPPEGVCWWHPWWGYICDVWQPTYDNFSFSYGAGIGLRGNLTETFFIEASYNQLWVDTSHADTLSFSGTRLNIGWNY